jgi:hypothetical protein
MAGIVCRLHDVVVGGLLLKRIILLRLRELGADVACDEVFWLLLERNNASGWRFDVVLRGLPIVRNSLQRLVGHSGWWTGRY